ncbi:MAG: shikimate kinase [Desulfobulbus sp.]
MKKKFNNIILTGFRATGKSTVGRILASRLGYRFIDTDSEICRQLGATIAEIVAQHGWPYFRQAEARLLRELCSSVNMIIATGGGAIEHRGEWEQLRQIGFVAWLDADADTINKRIASDPVSASQRPELSTKKKSVRDETAMLLQHRRPLYATGSDLRLDTVLDTPENLAAKLHETIRNLSGKSAAGTNEAEGGPLQ